MPEYDQDKKTKKQMYAEHLEKVVKIAKFNGSVIIRVDQVWQTMGSDLFASICYQEFGYSITRSMVQDLEHSFRNTAKDMSNRSHLISFGDKVWNTKKAKWDVLATQEECIYGIKYEPREPITRIKFIMDLACGDEGLYDDIMQSVAPLLLHRKPTGVIWYLGNGSNGKSSLVHLLYLVFGEYLTEVTVKQLEDERDAPLLNGKLGNICKESSEAFISDTRTYKSIGTHESFLVHKFHSQEMTSVNGNVHHIFSANNIPTFSDKSDGAKRRTLIIPFNNRFDSDETFEDRTFTEEFIEEFIGEMMKYAQTIKSRNYTYEMSSVSQKVKFQYDLDSNTSTTYVDEMMEEEGFRGFLNFLFLYQDYENWCGKNGYKPSSVNVFRRSVRDRGFNRKIIRKDKNVFSLYLHNESEYDDLEKISDMQPGILKIKEGKL